MTTAAAAEAGVAREGSGWVSFAGIVLIVSGLANLLDALWAFDHDDTRVDELLYSSSLTVWAWIFLCVALVLIVIGVSVLRRSEWAIHAAVFVAGIGLLLNMLWIFAFPIPSLVGIAFNLLVIYGLTVHTRATAAFR
jgi:uncharacterized membrane protein YozB (DUF420 family)